MTERSGKRRCKLNQGRGVRRHDESNKRRHWRNALFTGLYRPLAGACGGRHRQREKRYPVSPRSYASTASPGPRYAAPWRDWRRSVASSGGGGAARLPATESHEPQPPVRLPPSSTTRALLPPTPPSRLLEFKHTPIPDFLHREWPEVRRQRVDHPQGALCRSRAGRPRDRLRTRGDRPATHRAPPRQ